MLGYNIYDGKKFLSDDGHYILVHNYNIGYTVTNQFGINSDRKYNNLDQMVRSLDDIAWLSEEQKKDVESAFNELYDVAKEKSDVSVSEITYKYIKGGIFVIAKMNQYGYQILDEEHIHNEHLKDRLKHLEELYHIEPIQIYQD